jgi:hypothetical protein
VSVVDIIEKVGEPVFRIDVVQPASGKQTVEHSGILRTFMAAGKQVIFSPECHRANTVLYQIIVYLQNTIGGIDA